MNYLPPKLPPGAPPVYRPTQVTPRPPMLAAPGAMQGMPLAKGPGAPPPYRPLAGSSAAPPSKTANPLTPHKPAGAPPVYRPAPGIPRPPLAGGPGAMQRVPAGKGPGAPPAYRPIPVTPRLMATIARGASVMQLIPVSDADLHKAFIVNYNGGEVKADLMEIRGGGWYGFHSGAEGDFTIRGQANILRRASGPKERLSGANARARLRSHRWSPLGTRVDAPTPFGMTGLSRQRFSPLDPMTTTRETDFRGTSAVGAAYTGWAEGVGDQADFQKLVSTLDTHAAAPPRSFTRQQNRYAATLVGTTHYSEPRRFPGADKPARSAFRMIARGEKEPGDFEDLYPMAQGGGAHVYTNYLAGTGNLTPDQEKVLEEMSESSDNEDDPFLER
jgi:hypothetical protein